MVSYRMKLPQSLAKAAVLPLAIALGAGAVFAQPAALTDARQWPPVIRAVFDCRAIADGVQRLACYDAAVAKLDVATTKGDLVVVDKEQVRTLKRQAFGFSLPSLSLFSSKGAPKEDVDTQVELTLASAATPPDGHTLFTFDNGSTWRQVNLAEYRLPQKPGTKAVISRGLAGSFFMSLDGKPGVRVQRQR